MSEILQGGGGTPEEEDRKNLLQVATSGGGGNPSFENAIQAGQSGNASAPLAEYLSGTGNNPSIDYEYKPYVMPPATGNGEGGGSFDGVTGGTDYSDLLTPSGTPMPGHPAYSSYMMNNGGDPSNGGTNVSGGYTSFSDMFDGGGAGKSGVNFEGGPFSKSLNKMGVNPLGYNETAATNFETKGDNPSGGTGDTSFGGGIGTGGFEGYSGGEGPAGGASNDGTSGTGGYGMFNKGGNVVCPKCGKANCGCGYSQGGHVQYRLQGGSIWDTENQLQIKMNELPQKQRPAPTAGGSSGGQGMLGKVSGMATGMIMKKVLGTMLGGPLGMLLSQGGPVQYKSHGGGMQAPLGSKKTANAMKVESHTKGEARKDMKFAVDEKRKQELHEKKLRVI